MVENHINQKNSAYSYLKEKLLNCEILPGQYINEKDLIQGSDYGRTPLREALIMLQTENLIEVIPRQGTYAKKITKENVCNLFALRKLLEPSIATEYRTNIELQKLFDLDAQMLQLCRKSGKDYDAKAFYTLDISFHRLIASFTGNERITDTLEPLLQETYRIGIFNNLSNTENKPEETYEQHHKIIEAILSENNKTIREAFLVHLNHGLISSLSAIKE
jgi:GntR family transcriptional regulator, rspAB operon transcriptional repressor